MSSLKSLTIFVSTFLVATGAMAAPTSTVVNACYKRDTGTVHIVHSRSDCRRDEQFVSWNVEGPAGPAGAIGPAGPVGPTGPKGAIGASGPAGPIGPAGAKGPAGSPGATGATGAVGPVGATGATGLAGAAGVAGATGPAGAIGPAGPAGPSGPTGPEGPQGPAGTAGSATIPANLTVLSGVLSTNNGIAYEGANTFIYAATSSCVLGDIVLSINGYGEGALPADGRILPISQYTAVFALMGTNFGGNGTSDFALPDLRAFAPQGLQYSICVEGIFPSRL